MKELSTVCNMMFADLMPKIQANCVSGGPQLSIVLADDMNASVFTSLFFFIKGGHLKCLPSF